MGSITANSSKKQIYRERMKLWRYLRKNHMPEDRESVKDLILNMYPDEGINLIQDFALDNEEKHSMIVEWLYHEPQISAAFIADQRGGKDATLCAIFEEVCDYCDENGLIRPRVVTLNNMKKPPFVDDEDMFYSFRSIPFADEIYENGEYKGRRQVWIYCSEIETVLPAREPGSAENKIYSQLQGTMAQNGQKIFGCTKQLARVDLNFIRALNFKIIKYLNPENLNIEGVERNNFISDLAMWHMPQDKENKAETLALFNSKILNLEYELPEWWTKEYSEQFRDVDEEKIKDYVQEQFSNGLKVIQLSAMVFQKFRRDYSNSEIEEMIDFEKASI